MRPHRHIEFFPDFARETRFDRFTFFPFSTGKFPITSETVLEPPLGDQQFFASMNDRAPYIESFHKIPLGGRWR